MLMRIAIVEDEEIIRKGLVFAIDWLELGCVVVGSAGNGLEGLELIRKEKPDIVLTDIKMPRMSGLDMIVQATKDHTFYSVVLTSYSEFELAQKALRIGVSDYLLKPVDKEELKAVLEKLKSRMLHQEKYDVIEQISQKHVITAKDDWTIFKMARDSEDFYVKRTYELVRARYQEKISVNDVAEELGVSVSYLSRRLKSSLNITFVDLLNQYRIKKALALLEQGEWRIYEVSDQVGFREYKHFVSVFKKYTSISPSEFMKNRGTIIKSS